MNTLKKNIILLVLSSFLFSSAITDKTEERINESEKKVEESLKGVAESIDASYKKNLAGVEEFIFLVEIYDLLCLNKFIL